MRLDPDSDPDSDFDGGLRSYAIAVIGEIPEWRVTAAAWEYLSELTEAAEAATAERDWLRLREITDEVELASPLRATRLGKQPDKDPQRETSEQQAPEAVRERVNRLVHDLRTSGSQSPAADNARKPD